jgi:outer membrane lipoprotein carrier protein
MKRFVLILWASALLSLLAVPAWGIDNKALLDNIQKKYAGLKAIRAEYIRITTTPSMDGVFDTTATQTAEGILSFKKEAMLSLDQTHPRKEKLVTDGRTVWWYIPEEKLVHQYKNVDVYGEMKPLLDFLGGLSSLEGHFQVKVTPSTGAPETHHRLDLTRLNKDKGSGPDTITVWCSVKDYTLVAFKLTSLTGESTVFNLSSVQVDPALDDGLFKFTIPAGVEVVEEEAGGKK